MRAHAAKGMCGLEQGGVVSCVEALYHTIPSVHGIYYPAPAWLIRLRAYAMPSVPVPPVILLTDLVPRCRLLAAHGMVWYGNYGRWE